LVPIEQARQQTVADLSESYGQLISGQSTITGRLQVANKVSQEQNTLIGSLGLSHFSTSIKDKLGSVTSKVDKALNLAGTLNASSNSGDQNLPGTLINTLGKELLNINN